MRDTSGSACAESGSVGTTDFSYGVAQSQTKDSVGIFFEKPKYKKNGFMPYIKNDSVSSGGDGCGHKYVKEASAVSVAACVPTEGTCSLSKHKPKKSKVEGRQKLCEKCAKAGVVSKLRLYQIHINEAVLMCENEECTFSLNTTSCIVPRDFNTVKRLRRKLPASFRSLPVSPAPSTSSGSSGQGTDADQSRPSSPLSHTASDSCLLRRNHSSSRLVGRQAATSPSRPGGYASLPGQGSFSAYKSCKLDDADELSALLAGMQDVNDFSFYAADEPVPGQFSNAIEDLIDMDGKDDDFEVPLDKGDVGGGPARGQPAGMEDNLANGSGNQAEVMVISQEGAEKLAFSMDQAVSSSVAVSEAMLEAGASVSEEGSPEVGQLFEDGTASTEQGGACTSSDEPQHSGIEADEYVTETGQNLQYLDNEASSSYTVTRQEYAVESSTEGDTLTAMDNNQAFTLEGEDTGFVGQQGDVSTTGVREDDQSVDTAYTDQHGQYGYDVSQYAEEDHIVDVSQEVLEAGYEEAESSGQEAVADSGDDASQSVDQMAAQVLSSMTQGVAGVGKVFAQPQYQDDTAPQTSGQSDEFPADIMGSESVAAEVADSNSGQEVDRFASSAEGLVDSSQQQLEEDGQAQGYSQYEDMLHGEAQGEECAEEFPQPRHVTYEPEPEVSSSGVESRQASMQVEAEVIHQEEASSSDSYQNSGSIEEQQMTDMPTDQQSVDDGQVYQYSQEGSNAEAYQNLETEELVSEEVQQYHEDTHYQEAQHYQDAQPDQSQYQYIQTENGYELAQNIEQASEQYQDVQPEANQLSEQHGEEEEEPQQALAETEQYAVAPTDPSQHAGYSIEQSGQELQSGYQQAEETYQAMEYDESHQMTESSHEMNVEYVQDVESHGEVHYTEEQLAAGQYQVEEEQMAAGQYQVGEECGIQHAEQQHDISMEMEPSAAPTDMLAAASEIAGVNASEDMSSQETGSNETGSQEAGSQEIEGASDSETEEFVPVAIETRRVTSLESEETETVASGIQHLAVSESSQSQQRTVLTTTQGQHVTMVTPQGQQIAMVTSQGQPLTLMTPQGQTFTMVNAQGQKIQTLPASIASQLAQVVGGRQILTSASVQALLQRHMAQQQAGGVTILQAQPMQAPTLVTPSSAASLLRQTSLQMQQQTANVQTSAASQAAQAAPGVLPAAASSSQPGASAAAPSSSQAAPTPQPELPLTRILQDSPTTATGPKVLNLYVQWQNVDALCWLDVLLCPLVHSPTLTALMTPERTQAMEGTILAILMKAYRQAQGVLLNLLNRNAKPDLPGQDRAGSNYSPVSIVSKANIAEIGQAVAVLYAARENVWKTMQPRLRCEKGKHDSPVFAMPLLVRENAEMKHAFTIHYRLVFSCEACGYVQDDKHHKIMPSLPSVPEDFTMAEPCFVRPCFQCQTPGQRMRMIFESVQDFFLLHFVNGMPHNCFHELDFSFGGSNYSVTSVVQYKRNPDHFISWIRNAPDHMWMECDDLKSVLTRFQPGQPCIPPSQVHIVMWERNLTSDHARQFVNTPHTNLLASLVLTVQYPSSATSAPGAANPAAGPSPAAVPATHSTASQSPIQRVTYPAITSTRGRGRGRGGRGRGRGSTHTANIIRRPGPPVSVTPQLVAPATQQGAKQVIYTMGPVAPHQSATPTTSRIVVLKSSTGSLTTISPAILEALKKQGLNLSNMKVIQQVPGSGVSHQIPLAQILAKQGATGPTHTLMPISTQVAASEAEPQHSEASEAAAALVSSMQEEATTSVPTFTTVPQQVTTPGIQIHTVTSTAGATLLSHGTSLLTSGQVISSSLSAAGEGAPKVRSLLSSALTSQDMQAQGQQPILVKQVTSSMGAAPGQSSVLRIMPSTAKTVQVTPVSTTTSQGRRVVMLTQPSGTMARTGVNIVHPTLTTAGPTKYQLLTKPDGTRILTQIQSSPQHPSQQSGTSSVRVALEGEGGTRLISISSPSRAHQAAADSLTSLAGSLLGSTSTSPSSIVGTPLHEARSSNIRTSIVDAVMTSAGHTVNPIVISPPTASVAQPRIVSIAASPPTLSPSQPAMEPEVDESVASEAQNLLDIRHHLTFRSDIQPSKVQMASPKQVQKDLDDNDEADDDDKSENEADLDLAGLADEDWKAEYEFKAAPKRGRGRGRGRGGRGRGRGRGRARGRARGLPRTVMEELAPEDVYLEAPAVIRTVNISQSSLPLATFPMVGQTDMTENTDSSTSLPQDTPAPDGSEESVDVEMSDASQNGTTNAEQASVVTEAVKTVEVGSSYVLSQFEDSAGTEVVEEELVSADDMQVVEQEVTVGDQEVTVGEEVVCSQIEEEPVQEVAHLATEEAQQQQDEEQLEETREPTIIGRRGRRRQISGQKSNASRGMFGSLSPRGGRRRKMSEGKEELTAAHGTQTPYDEDEAESPGAASPARSPVASPCRAASQSPLRVASQSPRAASQSPLRVASQSPRTASQSPLRVASQSPRAASQSPVEAPCQSLETSASLASPRKSPAASPARESASLLTSQNFSSPSRLSMSPLARVPASPSKAPSASKEELFAEESFASPSRAESSVDDAASFLMASPLRVESSAEEPATSCQSTSSPRAEPSADESESSQITSPVRDEVSSEEPVETSLMSPSSCEITAEPMEASLMSPSDGEITAEAVGEEIVENETSKADNGSEEVVTEESPKTPSSTRKRGHRRKFGSRGRGGRKRTASKSVMSPVYRPVVDLAEAPLGSALEQKSDDYVVSSSVEEGCLDQPQDIIHIPSLDKLSASGDMPVIMDSAETEAVLNEPTGESMATLTVGSDQQNDSLVVAVPQEILPATPVVVKRGRGRPPKKSLQKTPPSNAVETESVAQQVAESVQPVAADRPTAGSIQSPAEQQETAEVEIEKVDQKALADELLPPIESPNVDSLAVDGLPAAENDGAATPSTPSRAARGRRKGRRGRRPVKRMTEVPTMQEQLATDTEIREEDREGPVDENKTDRNEAEEQMETDTLETINDRLDVNAEKLLNAVEIESPVEVKSPVKAGHDETEPPIDAVEIESPVKAGDEETEAPIDAVEIESPVKAGDEETEAPVDAVEIDSPAEVKSPVKAGDEETEASVDAVEIESPVKAGHEETKPLIDTVEIESPVIAGHEETEPPVAGTAQAEAVSSTPVQVRKRGRPPKSAGRRKGGHKSIKPAQEAEDAANVGVEGEAGEIKEEAVPVNADGQMPPVNADDQMPEDAMATSMQENIINEKELIAEPVAGISEAKCSDVEEDLSLVTSRGRRKKASAEPLFSWSPQEEVIKKSPTQNLEPSEEKQSQSPRRRRGRGRRSGKSPEDVSHPEKQEETEEATVEKQLLDAGTKRETPKRRGRAYSKAKSPDGENAFEKTNQIQTASDKNDAADKINQNAMDSLQLSEVFPVEVNESVDKVPAEGKIESELVSPTKIRSPLKQKVGRRKKDVTLDEENQTKLIVDNMVDMRSEENELQVDSAAKMDSPRKPRGGRHKKDKNLEEDEQEKPAVLNTAQEPDGKIAAVLEIPKRRRSGQHKKEWPLDVKDLAEDVEKISDGQVEEQESQTVHTGKRQSGRLKNRKSVDAVNLTEKVEGDNESQTEENQGVEPVPPSRMQGGRRRKIEHVVAGDTLEEDKAESRLSPSAEWKSPVVDKPEVVETVAAVDTPRRRGRQRKRETSSDQTDKVKLADAEISKVVEQSPLEAGNVDTEVAGGTVNEQSDEKIAENAADEEISREAGSSQRADEREKETKEEEEVSSPLENTANNKITVKRAKGRPRKTDKLTRSETLEAVTVVCDGGEAENVDTVTGATSHILDDKGEENIYEVTDRKDDPLLASPSRFKDNIFDIMSEVSATSLTTETKLPGKREKRQKSSPGKSPASAAKKESREKAVVKRRSDNSVPRGDTPFVPISASKAQRMEKRTPAHSRADSEGAVVIRRRPRPLPSPDAHAPAMSSIISPVRPCSQVDYSQGYSSVIIKRRRTADWGVICASPEKGLARFSATTFKVDGDFGGMTGAGARALNSVPHDTSVSESPSKSGRQKKSPKADRQPRTKVQAVDYDSDGEVTFKMTVPNHAADTAPVVSASDGDSSGCDSDDFLSLAAANDNQSDSAGMSDSAVRRSSRPVVPSQRLLESNLLKRRLSGDLMEETKKRSRTLH